MSKTNLVTDGPRQQERSAWGGPYMFTSPNQAEPLDGSHLEEESLG